MRGVAALLVVWFHVAEVYAVPAPASAYLAVDMFFVLSGFVLARTYEPRFEAGLTARDFMKARAIRLYPLYLAGLAIGLIALALMWRDGGLSTAGLAGAALFGSVLLPAPVHFQPPRLFPANGPSWSLFCEYWIANLAMAVLWRFLTNRRLAAILAVSGTALAIYAWRHHNLDQGSTWGTLPGAILRVLFSFTAGMALWRVYRVRGPWLQLPSLLLLALLALMLCVPAVGRARSLYDCALVLFAFPALVYLGAGAKERRPRLGAIAGDLSYAIYVLHAPLLALLLRLRPTAGAATDWLIGGAFVGVMLVIGLVAHRLELQARRRFTAPKSPA